MNSAYCYSGVLDFCDSVPQSHICADTFEARLPVSVKFISMQEILRHTSDIACLTRRDFNGSERNIPGKASTKLIRRFEYKLSYDGFKGDSDPGPYPFRSATYCRRHHSLALPNYDELGANCGSRHYAGLSSRQWTLSRHRRRQSEATHASQSASPGSSRL